MGAAEMMRRIEEASPRLKARVAGSFYVLAVATGRVRRGFRSRQVALCSRAHPGRGLCRCDAAALSDI